MQSFIEGALNGEVALNEIDDWVDRWHDAETVTQSLQDYLGFTDAEYDLWAKGDSFLPQIIANRRATLRQSSVG